MGLPPGEFVYGNSEADTLNGFTLASDVASGSAIEVAEDRPFSLAVRVEVTESTDDPWGANYYGQVDGRSVGAGDVLLGVFYLRGPAESETTPTVQFSAKTEGNLDTNLVRSSPEVTPPTEWTRYYVPIEVAEDAEAGSWWVELFLGYGPQTVDIGGAAVVDFGQAVAVEALPSGPVGGPPTPRRRRRRAPRTPPPHARRPLPGTRRRGRPTPRARTWPRGNGGRRGRTAAPRPARRHGSGNRLRMF